MISVRAGAVIIGVTATLLLAGCGGGPQAGQPAADSTFTFALASDPSCLNPRVAGNNDGAYPSRQLVDSLTDQDPETGEIKPWLAESFKASDDARQFTFTLRDGVTFSDGGRVSAKSIKENFDEIIQHGAEQPNALQFLSGYRRTVVVDELTARVEFETPNAQFLQASASHFLGLLAPSSLATPPAERCAGNLIGSGPFVLDRYTKNTEVVETRREGYAWGSSLWQRSGAAVSQKLIFKVIPESGVRSGALKSGQVDAIGGVPPQDEAALKAGGFTLQVRPNPGQVFALRPNLKRAPLTDVRVRQALSAAIDRDAVVKAVLSPSFGTASSTLARTTPGWVDLSAGLQSDPDRARQLLDQAGWTPGPDGIRTKEGKRLTLLTYWSTNFNPNQAALELIQQQAREVGIELDLNSAPIGDLQSKLATGEFDLSWGNSTRPDPDILRNVYWQNGNTPYGLSDRKLIKLLDGQQATNDQAERNRLAGQAQQIIIDEAYGIPVFELTTVLGLAKGVEGVRFDSYSRLQLHGAVAGSGSG
ncbi:ABC transporter substrate-binding protein [Microlunatus sp. GCM10028923]|uniref:ABC transporter substrate-binding protein n=1 Tax=Microlunatus sp. GCM10028923 TaxID=3273400 RepID=UPI0036131CF0